MKYQISTAASTTRRQPKLGLEAATEALVESYGRLGQAYEELVAAEGRVELVDQVMEDCKTALNSIQKCGVTVETMSILNGKDHALDRGLGLEELDIESIESLSESSRKVLQGKYSAALEGAIGEAWDKVVQFLKDLWEKIVRWFKELFDSNAKYVRIVSENLDKFSKIGEANEKEISGITAPMAKAALDAADELLAKVTEYAGVCRRKEVNKELFPLPDKAKLEKVGITTDQDGRLNTDGMKEKLSKEKKSIKDLGWTSDVTLPKRFCFSATGKDAKAASDSMDRAFKVMIAEAEQAKGKAEGDDAKKAAADNIKQLTDIRKATMNRSSSYMATYKRLIDAVGTTLLSIISAVK